MKAIKVTVDFNEWSKVNDFIRKIQHDEIFAYQIDNISFIIVTEGECSMAWIRTNLPIFFDDASIIELK